METRSENFFAAFKGRDLGVLTVLHWDGKLLPDFIGKIKVDRLPVLITYDGKEKMLRIPKIESGSERTKPLRCTNCCKIGNLPIKYKLCCDTSSSNMGRFQGACVYLVQILQLDLLYLPCRHHIYEMILRGAFDEKISQSSGPTISIFKNFQKSWPKISNQKFIQELKMSMSASQFRIQMKYLSLQCKLYKKSSSCAKITANSWSSSSFS